MDHWLAANVHGWTAVGLQASYYQSRYLGDSGRLFFNSADALVAGDGNKKADVYEYEPAGVGSCRTESTAGGCVALITSGESERESAFLDASESGDDVFFLTSAKLSGQDGDTAADIYDARVCAVAGAEPCPAPAAQPPSPCSGEACKGPSSPQPSYGEPASSTFSGNGNLLPQSHVSASKSRQEGADAGAEARRGTEGLPQAQTEEETGRLRSTRSQELRRQKGEREESATRSSAPCRGAHCTQGPAMKRARPARIRALAGAALAAAALLASAGAGQALAAGPHWEIVARSAPSFLQPGKKGEITAVVLNLGDAPAIATEANPLVITDDLPAGVVAAER